RAALMSWRTLQRVVETFERVRAGQTPLDPTIDVVKTLNRSREQILARMPHNLRTLKHLLKTAGQDFQALLRASTTGQKRLRRAMWRRLRKAVRLTEEMSPRIELLDWWTDELTELSGQIDALSRATASGHRSAADRERRTKLHKELRALLL